MLLRTPFLSLFVGCAALALPACGGSTATPDAENPVIADSGPDTRPVVDGGAEASVEAIACNPVTTSTLPHVHIVFQATKCTFTLAEAAAKISIPYDLVVDEDVPGFVPASPYRYGSSAANLVLDEDIKGGTQLYCLCDTGLPAPLCPLDDGGDVFSDAGPLGGCPAVTIPAGTYHRVITWDGRNWTGPSDTDNPEGPPFPPGDYAVEVATEQGSIGDAGALFASGKLPIRLVP
jgi:hypothetical protein